MTYRAGFRDLTRLTAILKVSLGVYAAVAVACLWAGWLEIDILQRALRDLETSEAEADASDSRQEVLAGLQLLVFVVTGVLFLRWTYLANRNARYLGGKGMEFTPGWAVAWYFIPVASLWKPFLALKETAKASNPDFEVDWKQASHPGILEFLWALWIIASVAGMAAVRSARGAETIEDYLTASRVMFASDAVDVPLGVVAAVVVAKLQEWQREKHRRQVAAAT